MKLLQRDEKIGDGFAFWDKKKVQECKNWLRFPEPKAKKRYRFPEPYAYFICFKGF